MPEYENELDKLRAMLTEANIPFESVKEEWDPKTLETNSGYYSGNYRFRRNQIIYGKYEREDSFPDWKLDGICQLGSYGAKEGLIETYGSLGTDAEGDPLVLRADDVFQIIQEDWEKTNEH